MLDDNVGVSRWAAPMFKGPFTDMFLHIRNLQCLKECAQYELYYIDCMEAYGYHKGKKECRMILNDMYECVMKIKRIRRIHAMDDERLRQFKSGERPKQFTEEPPLDLF